MIDAATPGGERPESSDRSDKRPFDGRPPKSDHMHPAHLQEFRLLAGNTQSPPRATQAVAESATAWDATFGKVTTTAAADLRPIAAFGWRWPEHWFRR